jgi:hypothetical protein
MSLFLTDSAIVYLRVLHVRVQVLLYDCDAEIDHFDTNDAL